jgi:thymidylate synthase
MIVANGINDAWVRVLSQLYCDGKESSPRGKKIKELKNVSVEIRDPKKRILSLPVRNISLPFAFGELIWYLTARNDVSMMEYYSKGMKNFSDDGETLNSAYGYRIFGHHQSLPFDQWDHVVKQLKEDPDTRQAIIHLHTPNNKPTKDEVCTLSLQFMIRDNKLDMITNMRSNDIIKGFTYDVFSFTSMQELMANELGIEVGTYYHNAASMHIYENDYFYFDHLKIIDELLHMTQYDVQFDYEGLTIHDDDLVELFKAESLLRITDVKGISSKVNIKNKTLNLITEILALYRLYKNYGIQTVLINLKYDNLYHGLMRNYIHRNTLDHSTMFIFDGCDGAGKSSYIDRVIEKSVYDVIAFVKPEDDFNKLIYFQTALTRGNIVLDRFYYSEWVYSIIFDRKCRLNNSDIKVLESLLNYRNATFVFMDTDPDICFNRLDEIDSKVFSREQIKRICESYELNFRVSEIKSKMRMKFD